MFTKSTSFKVVINHEEQYSILPADQTLSRGMRLAGKTGSTSECLKFIEEVWTDMKPGDKELILRSIGK